LESHRAIGQGAEGLDLIGRVLPDDEAVHAGELVNPGDSACGEWFTPEIIEDWITARPQDFAKGFVSCWKAWKRSWKLSVPAPRGLCGRCLSRRLTKSSGSARSYVTRPFFGHY
jgi:hypothetical protein